MTCSYHISNNIFNYKGLYLLSKRSCTTNMSLPPSPGDKDERSPPEPLASAPGQPAPGQPAPGQPAPQRLSPPGRILRRRHRRYLRRAAAMRQARRGGQGASREGTRPRPLSLSFIFHTDAESPPPSPYPLRD